MYKNTDPKFSTCWKNGSQQKEIKDKSINISNIRTIKVQKKQESIVQLFILSYQALIYFLTTQNAFTRLMQNRCQWFPTSVLHNNILLRVRKVFCNAVHYKNKCFHFPDYVVFN